MVSVFVVLTVIATASAASVSRRDEASVFLLLNSPRFAPDEFISRSCSAAINNTLYSTDPGMFCLRTGPLTEIVKSATTHENLAPVARVDEIEGWLEFMCETGFCRCVAVVISSMRLVFFTDINISPSPQTLESIASTIEAGCGSDLSGLPGITLPQGLSVVTALKQNYPVVRDLLCLRKCVTTRPISFFPKPRSDLHHITAPPKATNSA